MNGIVCRLNSSVFFAIPTDTHCYVLCEGLPTTVDGIFHTGRTENPQADHPEAPLTAKQQCKTDSLLFQYLMFYLVLSFQPSQEELLVEKWNNSFSLCQEHIRDLVVSDLPDELWLKIYSYLNPRDLCRCARVCKVWAGLSRDMSLWHSIWPTRWARGNWSFNKPEEEEEEEEEDIWDSSLCCVQGNSSMGWGSKGGKDSSEFDVEHRVFMGVVKHLLPIVGMSVKRVGMAHSRVLTNALVSREHENNVEDGQDKQVERPDKCSYASGQTNILTDRQTDRQID